MLNSRDKFQSEDQFKKTKIVGENILGLKLRVKNSSRKIFGKIGIVDEKILDCEIEKFSVEKRRKILKSMKKLKIEKLIEKFYWKITGKH